MVRRLYRLLLCALLLLSFFTVTYPLSLLIKDKKKKLTLATRLSSLWCRMLLKALVVRVDTKIHSSSPGKKYLIVANHLSYLDIFVISSVMPSVFVASVDGVKENLILGKITELSGGVFIERRRKWGILREIEEISGIMNMGFNVVLFPEGTTSNGAGLLPFKTPFFRAPQLSRVDVLPICIKYTKTNGEALSIENMFSVFFYGKITFFKHLFKLLSLKSINVELSLLRPIGTEETECRKELADLAFKAINKEYITKRYKIYDYKTQTYYEKSYTGVSNFTEDGFSY